MSEGHGVPSEPEGGRADGPSPRPAPCQQQLPVLPSWHVCKSLFLLGDAAEFGREAPSLSLWVSAGAGEPRVSLSGPRLPHVQAWPCSLLSLQRRIHFGAGCSEAPGPHVQIWGASLGLPPLTQRQTLDNSTAQREECWGRDFLQTSPIGRNAGSLFFAYSHQTTPLHQPEPDSFLWTKQVGSPSPQGLGVKQQLLAEP